LLRDDSIIFGQKFHLDSLAEKSIKPLPHHDKLKKRLTFVKNTTTLAILSTIKYGILSLGIYMAPQSASKLRSAMSLMERTFSAMQAQQFLADTPRVSESNMQLADTDKMCHSPRTLSLYQAQTPRSITSAPFTVHMHRTPCFSRAGKFASTVSAISTASAANKFCHFRTDGD
jgi:hypothetical protein